MALSVEFIYLTARLARQWIKERGIIDMYVIYITFYTTMRNKL